MRRARGMRRAEDVVWKRETRRRERVRAERVRRVVMAATSAATIWAASLESARRVANFARGKTKVTFEEVAVRVARSARRGDARARVV